MRPDHAGHCADYSRAELLRATMTSAMPGAGLPSIEPGMPLPAGTGLSRRKFLTRAGGLALAVFGGSALAPRQFEAGIAAASAAAPQDRVLVSIFCSGGLDGLSVLAPARDAAFRAARPTLGLTVDRSAGEFSDDERLYWHPNAAPLRDLHDRGALAVAPSIGYPDPNGSHFTSRHFWEVGALDPSSRAGWLGRYLDIHGRPDNPLQGLALSWSLSPALAAEKVPVATVSEPEDFGLWMRDVWDDGLRSKLWDALGTVGSLPTQDPAIASARSALSATSQMRRTLEPLQGETFPFGSTVPYPESSDPFPRRLAALARMLEAGLPLKCVSLEANGGYDLHEQLAMHMPENIDLLSRSLAAFQADLEARGLADRVVTQVWSEFGRRVQENGSGVDHGAGGLSLLMGSSLTGSLIGEFGGMGSAGVVDGNLRATADFRGVYASLLEQWFDVDAAEILPGAASLPRYALIA